MIIYYFDGDPNDNSAANSGGDTSDGSTAAGDSGKESNQTADAE